MSRHADSTHSASFSLLISEGKAGYSHLDEMPTGGVKIGTPGRNKTLLEIGLHKEILKAKKNRHICLSNRVQFNYLICE